MKTQTTPKAAAERAPRLYSPIRNPLPPRPAQAEVWPGLTRAQLRDIVIDQIG